MSMEEKGGVSAAEEKLAQAQELIIKPIDLSEEERKRLEEVVALIKESLDEMLKEALTKPRDEAFTIVGDYTRALLSARGKAAQTEEAISPEGTVPLEEVIPVVHPELDDLFYGLPAGFSRRAREVLNCVKQYRKLEEMGEEPTQVLCPDCTPKKMIECIRSEDPTIIDELDEEIREELRKAGLLRVDGA